mgnify:CR=1 FL=1
MRIDSKLCHISGSKAIVKVSGWIDDKKVGSALAEGPTVEIAEDTAISRLHKRINKINNNDENNNLTNSKINNNQLKTEITKSDMIQTSKLSSDPQDWSSELTHIDEEIKRLNWSRDDELIFLQKTLGHNNRNKITKYNELINYLNILKNIDKEESVTIKKTNIDSLIEQSEIILRELSWDHQKGREYLQKEFNVSTRKELNEKQLKEFVFKLKSIGNQSSTQ